MRLGGLGGIGYRGGRLAWLTIVLLAALQLPGCAAFHAARAYQRGSAALESGDSARAIAELESAALWVPHASEIQNHLGIAYSMDGRREDALGAFRRAVELDCDNQAALRNLAEAEQLEASRLGNSRLGEAEPLR